MDVAEEMQQYETDFRGFDSVRLVTATVPKPSPSQVRRLKVKVGTRLKIKKGADQSASCQP